MSKFVERSFTNELGQVIEPGDDVIYVATSWKTTRIQKAVFRGVYEYDEKTDWYKPEDGIVAVKVDGIPDKRFVWNGPGDYYHKDVLRCAILPLKRVYKIDTSALDIQL